jgi:multidrug efflux pump subunit AcrB
LYTFVVYVRLKDERERGKSRIEPALIGARELRGPIIAMTITT